MGKYEVISGNNKKIKRMITLVASILIILVGGIFGVYYFLSLEKESKIIDNNIKLAKKKKDTSSDNKTSSVESKYNETTNTTDNKEEVVKTKGIVIDIKGQIKRPGTYEVELGTRVIDVINIAGGLTSNADTSLINLSKKVFDEMVIIVHSKEEVTKINSKSDNKSSNSNTNINNDASINNDNTNTKTPSIVNLNTATLEELVTLSGIGEAKAQDIINYRNSNGNFKTIEEVMNVPGIGESLFAKIKENITV